jgi:hypothetical protein
MDHMARLAMRLEFVSAQLARLASRLKKTVAEGRKVDSEKLLALSRRLTTEIEELKAACAEV